MALILVFRRLIKIAFSICISISCFNNSAIARDINHLSVNNFGLPGLMDLPTAWRLPDGELVLTQQLHKSLARSGTSFQILPRVEFHFDIQGMEEAEVKHMDGLIMIEVSMLKFLFSMKEPYSALSIGLRDFIGTGWYSSEYFVLSKNMGNLGLTAGMGFGIFRT